MTTNSRPAGQPAKRPAEPQRSWADASPRSGGSPIQRWLVTLALTLVAALVGASQVGCGGSPEPLDEPRSAIPASPAASAAI